MLRGSSRARAPPPAALLTMRRRSKHLGAPGVDTATLLCVLRGMLCPGNVSHRLASVCDGGDHDLRLAEAPRIMARRPCHQHQPSGLGEAVECALVRTRASNIHDAQASASIARWASDSRARNVRTLARRTHVGSGSASTPDASAGIPLVRWRACQVPDLQVEMQENQKGSFACLYTRAC